MIRQNLLLLFKNVKYGMAVFLLLFFTFIFLLYQEKNDVLDGQQKSIALNWALEQEDPVSMSRQAAFSVSSGTVFEGAPELSGNAYMDYTLWMNIASYIEQQTGYAETMESVFSSLQSQINSSISSDETKAKASHTYAVYASMPSVTVNTGNYMAWEKFFELDLVDLVLVLAMFISVYFMLIQERERGLEHLMFATKNGGCGYFIIKAVSMAVISVVLCCLFMGVKLAVYGSLYGLNGASGSIQSLNGYSMSTSALSIAEYAVVYFLLKVAAAALTAVMMTVVCSFALSEAGCGIVLAVAGGLFFAVRYGISGYGRFVIFRDLGLLTLWNPQYWFSSYHCYTLGRIGSGYLLTDGNSLLCYAYAFYALVFCAAGLLIYHRGLHKSGVKRPGLNWLISFKGSKLNNELLFLSVKKFVAVICLLLIAIPVYSVLDFSNYTREDIAFERQCVELLNEMSYDDAVVWLFEKEAEYDEMEASLEELNVKLGNGELSADAYSVMSNYYTTQLSLRTYVDNLCAQADEMKSVYDSGIDVKFEYTSLSKQIFGNAGTNERLMLSIFIGLFVILSVMTVFPADSQLKLNRLFCSVPDASKSMRFRVILLELYVFLMTVAVHALWLFSLKCRYQLTGVDACMQSWSFFKNSSLKMSVMQVICAGIVWQGIKWVVLCGFGLWISMKISNVAMVQIIGIIVFLCPLAVGLVGAEWIKYLPYYSFLYFNIDGFFTSAGGAAITAAAFVAAAVLTERGRSEWMKMR